MFATSRLLGITLGVCALVGCAKTTVVQHIKPAPPLPALERISEVDRKERSLVSIYRTLDAVKEYETRLAAGDRSSETIAAYNYSVARAVEAIEATEADPWGGGVTISTSDGSYLLKARTDIKDRKFSASDYRMIPTDQFKISGTYFEHMHPPKPGVGAPIAVVSDQPNKGLKHDLGESAVYGTATVTISFSGNRAELVMHESLRLDEVTLKGRTYPLAADYSTPIALMVHNSKVESLGLVRLLVPERYADTARMTRLQLYDRERIPLVLVHGLDSTPGTWTPMLDAIRYDPELRKRYQLWVFSYPSGYPYPYTATLLRQELDRMNQRFPGHKPVVLVGHSMGGIINRLMVTDSGDSIWRSYFGKSPERTHVPGRFRSELERTLIFEHRRDIDRMIYISSPHRGSEIAITSFGRMFSRLVRAPRLIADARDALVSVMTVDATALTLERAPSSIDTLAPNNRFVKAVSKLPVEKSIPFHSIMGDRGRGDTPNSSDGVVPYWSSHLDGAVSEKIVPSGHSAHQNPEGIQETLRILHAHLRNGSSR